mmetsp:Transcript_5827/g.14464  ORF Transcript_5827/g.14464 Transcript_5827/m.14464 type:complete len:92 (-) Transcript_5827:6-281(-)
MLLAQHPTIQSTKMYRYTAMIAIGEWHTKLFCSSVSGFQFQFQSHTALRVKLISASLIYYVVDYKSFFFRKYLFRYDTCKYVTTNKIPIDM